MFSSGWPPKLSLLLLVKSYSVFIYYYLRSFYTTGYGPNTLDKFAMSEDLKFIKVKTSNWNEFVFRFRSILEKHRLLDTISNDAVIRAAAVVQEALLDDFAAAGAGGVMEMSTYDQNRYKVVSASYDKNMIKELRKLAISFKVALMTLLTGLFVISLSMIIMLGSSHCSELCNPLQLPQFETILKNCTTQSNQLCLVMMH